MSLGRATSKDQLLASCLQYVRSLREMFLQMPSIIGDDATSSSKAATLEKLFRRVEETYNKLEKIAELLPDTFAISEDLQQLCIEYQDGSVIEEDNQEEISANKEFLVESYLNSINFLDNYSILSYCWEQSLKLEMYRMRRRSIVFPPEQVSTTYTMKNHPHIIFRAALRRIKDDAVFKRFGLWYKILDESSLGCVLEVTAGCLTDKLAIVTQKTLVVENNGNIDAVVFIAPHEEWQYLDHPDGFGEHRVDVLQKSRYEVYRKLTAVASDTILQYVRQTPEGRSNASPQQVLQNLFVILPRYHRMFEAKCRSCGKIMKDCLPCVYYDPRNPLQSVHESCR